MTDLILKNKKTNKRRAQKYKNIRKLYTQGEQNEIKKS